jgi:cytidine deaminase
MVAIQSYHQRTLCRQWSGLSARPVLPGVVGWKGPQVGVERLSDDDRSRLLRAAREVTSRAYAPYSKLQVGAAVLTESRGIFLGCNVENASYDLTVCAERSAIFAAVASEGGEHMRIRALAVFTANQTPGSPCGACRQVIYEFGPHAIVIFQGQEQLEEWTASKLLPCPFTLE